MEGGDEVNGNEDGCKEKEKMMEEGIKDEEEATISGPVTLEWDLGLPR